jgi:hypothetical protein
MIELTQKYGKEDGAMVSTKLHHKPSNLDALGSLSGTTFAASAGELLRYINSVLRPLRDVP